MIRKNISQRRPSSNFLSQATPQQTLESLWSQNHPRRNKKHKLGRLKRMLIVKKTKRQWFLRKTKECMFKRTITKIKRDNERSQMRALNIKEMSKFLSQNQMWRRNQCTQRRRIRKQRKTLKKLNTILKKS